VIVEHWTDTRQSLVLLGPYADLCSVAVALRLPPDAIVQVSPLRSALALWGDTLAAYRDLGQPESECIGQPSTAQLWSRI
jgi:hypothetical protein